MTNDQRKELMSDEFNVLYVLKHAGKLNNMDFRPHSQAVLQLLFQDAYANYECPSVGITLWTITTKGLGRMYNHIDIHGPMAPALDDVLNPDAAHRVRMRSIRAAALLPRNDGLPDSEQGAYKKYFVYRADGSDKPGGKHHGDEHFVLNLTTDVHARAALRAYAESCRDTHPQLSADLAQKAGVVTDATPVDGKAFMAHAIKVMDECFPGLKRAAPSPLRGRLYADGSLVIDNPATPLVVRPLAHVDALVADPLTFNLNEPAAVDQFVTAAITQLTKAPQ